MVKKIDFIFLENKKKYIPACIKYSDICYVGFKHNKLYEYGVSANKIWDYMMSSKPIIMSIKSCNDPISEQSAALQLVQE